MNNYKDFEVKDWLEDLRFQRWVYHAESDMFFQNFIQNNPEQAPVLDQAREILLSVRGELDRISGAEVKLRVARILNALPDQEQPHSPWWKSNWLKVAAVLIFAFGIGLNLYKRSSVPDIAQLESQQTGKSARTMQVTNHTDVIRLVNLPDGSSVILKPHARITYPERFEQGKREVTMVGEAFFEVVKNPAQPFFVYAGTMVTKVKGTSFSIRANEGDDEVKLVVKTGIVEVSALESQAANEPQQWNRLTLKPNEQVTFNQKSKILTTVAVPKPVLLDLPVEKQEFAFKRTPLAEVFALLESTYGVPIRFDREAISECTITARLGDEPITEKLDMICSVVNARYELKNGSIAVTSPGCD